MSSYRPKTPPKPDPGDRIVPKAEATTTLARSTLTLEALVVFFATLVAHGLDEIPRQTLWIVGGVIMLVLILVSGRVKTRGGLMAGWVLQGVVVATGLVIPTMFIVGGLFAIIWAASLVIGRKIDRERREWDEAHPELAPNTTRNSDKV